VYIFLDQYNYRNKSEHISLDVSLSLSAAARSIRGIMFKFLKSITFFHYCTY